MEAELFHSDGWTDRHDEANSQLAYIVNRQGYIFRYRRVGGHCLKNMIKFYLRKRAGKSRVSAGLTDSPAAN
jgi:hypothetical protein